MDRRADRQASGLAAGEEARTTPVQSPAAPADADLAEPKPADLRVGHVVAAVGAPDEERQPGIGASPAPYRDCVLIRERAEAEKRVAIGIDERDREAFRRAVLAVEPQRDRRRQSRGAGDRGREQAADRVGEKSSGRIEASGPLSSREAAPALGVAPVILSEPCSADGDL